MIYQCENLQNSSIRKFPSDVCLLRFSHVSMGGETEKAHIGTAYERRRCVDSGELRGG
jgi:hypothetical protein